MKKIKDYIFNKEMILYLVFGVLTTLVNWGSYYLLDLALGKKFILLTNIIAWAASVAFAFVTNKVFVFESRSTDKKVLAREISEFAGARLLSLGVEEGGLFVVKIFGWTGTLFKVFNINITGDFAAKILLAVVVVILNYFFSKFVIFRRKGKEKNEA